MHIPTFHSLVCLSLLAAPYVSAFPLDENLQPRAATTCDANHVKTVKNSYKQPLPSCKSWLASKHSKSTVQGLNVAQVSSACKCIQESASSSSVAAAKKTTISTKKASSAKKVASSTRKITSSTKKATTSIMKTTLKKALVATRASSSSTKSSSTKKTSTSSQKTTSKATSTQVQSTSKKISSTLLKPSTSTHKTTARSTSVTSEKSTWTPVSTKQSSSSIKTSSGSIPAVLTASSSASTHSTIPASSTLSSSTSSAITSSRSSSSAVISNTLTSALSSATPIPTDPDSDVVANQKAPTSVATRSASDTQTSTSDAASSETSSPPVNSNSASTGSNTITNGNFNGGSTTGWHGARAYGTKFSVASLAGDSNYEALVKYALAANDNASGQLYQNVSIPANSAWQLSANVYLNYPSGLPAGVSCVVKYSLGSDSIILKQYGATSISGAVLSDTASGQLSQAFSGRFQIDTYCNSASSSTASFALGFGNIQLLISDAVSAATTSSAASVASTTASSPSKSSSAASASSTATNMLTNGDFGTGDYSGWALYRLGNPTFAIQGNPNAYVSVITFPAGGDSNSQAALLQQPASVEAGKTYSFSMGLLLNYPSGLPADGAACSLQVYLVDSNGFGMLFAQTKYGNGDAGYQSITGTGTVNSGFDGNFDIMLGCYGSAQAIIAGVEDVVVSEA